MHPQQLATPRYIHPHMILPIRIFGDEILREQAEDVTENSPEIQALIDDLLETMANAPGIGLAATQVGRRERIFVADLTSREEESEEVLPEQPMVFINPEIIEEGDEEVEYDEGCLSIPDITETVWRPDRIRIRYLDRQFKEHEEELSGVLARVIQHEYDHLEGILFIDRISPLRRRLLRRKLREMSRGEVDAEYPVSWGSE